MATIQIRDIPDDTYQQIRQQAQDAGQSLQAYMRQRVIELAQRRARKAEMLAEMNELLARGGGAGATIEDILADLDADRDR